MKYSKLFGKVVREARRDMQTPSHKLLYQAGFIRELSAGRYEFLPLGMRTWTKVVALIDEEMEKIGSQRFSIPVLQPMEFWTKSNRDQVWGKSLMRIKDRNDREFALSATGEAVVTDLVAKTKPSYKDLPIIVHQFIIKLRDEMRPHGGLLRTREFVMKDAYSYHISEEDFMKTYQDFYDAYSAICGRLELDVYPCVADSGALGGDYCHEFQVPCDSGDDLIVKCEGCGYAASNEKAEFAREKVNAEEEVKPFKEVELPWEVGTMKQLTQHYGLSAEKFIKNVVYKTQKGKLIIGIVTGDLQVNEVKLANAVGEGELTEATPEDLASIGATSGSVYSWGYEEFRDRVMFVADESIPLAKNLCGGYKTKTTDPINVNYERDFEADMVADIAEAYESAKCKKCGETLKLIKTIEFGHIFKYDHFYTKHHDGYFIDKDGKEKLMWMGAYGIGIGRAMAIVVEKHHDEHGIIWPKSVAPFDIHILSLGESQEVREKAEELYLNLQEQGCEVLWDDREDSSAGVKFAVADLIGVPLQIIIGKRSVDKNTYDCKIREGNQKLEMSLEEIISFVADRG